MLAADVMIRILAGKTRSAHSALTLLSLFVAKLKGTNLTIISTRKKKKDKGKSGGYFLNVGWLLFCVNNIRDHGGGAMCVILIVEGHT